METELRWRQSTEMNAPARSDSKDATHQIAVRQKGHMKHIYIPSQNVESWKQFLAQPDKQWKKGFSARTLATCWEAADGFPPEIVEMFKRSPFKILHDAEILFAFPEHKVPLPGGKTESQNDIFILGKAGPDIVSITVEGKVDESFGPAVGKWLVDGRTGKQTRLNYLKQQLGIDGEIPHTIAYQLLHRTASAVIEANRFNAKMALMIIHSFSQDNARLEDYLQFLNLLGVHGGINELVFIKETQGVELYCGWVKGNPQFLEH